MSLHYRNALKVTILLALSGCPESRMGDGLIPEPGDAEPPLRDASTPEVDAGPIEDIPIEDLPERCWSDTSVPCRCEDGELGLRYCVERTWSDACECTPEPVEPRPDGSSPGDGGAPSGEGCVTGDPEWCDGRDNDCDGAVDEGQPCPDPSTSHTLPFDGVVYAVVTDGGSTKLVGVWPPAAEGETVDDFDRELDYWAAIRRGPGGSFFYEHRGVVYERRVGEDLEVPTPPCFGEQGGWFDFDQTGVIYYRCGQTLRRGDGELVRSLAGGDYRLSRLVRDHVYLEDIDRSGAVWLPPVGEPQPIDFPFEGWVGEVEAIEFTFNAPVAGNAMFIVGLRRYRGTTREEGVILRVDGGDSVAKVVRRVPVPNHSGRFIGLPDGTLVRMDNARPPRIFVLPPDAPAYVAYESSAQKVVYLAR